MNKMIIYFHPKGFHVIEYNKVSNSNFTYLLFGQEYVQMEVVSTIFVFLQFRSQPQADLTKLFIIATSRLGMATTPVTAWRSRRSCNHTQDSLNTGNGVVVAAQNSGITMQLLVQVL